MGDEEGLVKIGVHLNEGSGLRARGVRSFDWYRFYALESQERALRAQAAYLRAEELMRRTRSLIERSRRLRYSLLDSRIPENRVSGF